jgi:hypothetical protein
MLVAVIADDFAVINLGQDARPPLPIKTMLASSTTTTSVFSIVYGFTSTSSSSVTS